MSNIITKFADYLRARRISPVLVGVVLTLLIWLLGVIFVWMLITRTGPTKSTKDEMKPVEVEVLRRVIDGAVVDDALKTSPVIYAVMIDNILEARPPAGLSKASLVFEMPVEMGLTRFMAVYADGDVVSKIGPIRSARSYSVDLATEFKGLMVHIGGSPVALDKLSGELGILNVDEQAGSKTIFRSSKRSAPHNAYTSSENISALILRRERAGGEVAPWLYRDERKLEDRSGNAGVVINFSKYQYEAEWKYDSASNSYIRYEGRVRHKDDDGTEIRAKNVAVMVTSATPVAGDEKGRLDMSVIGEGKAFIFSEGAVTNGTWKKPSAKDRVRFYNEDGGEVSFISGTTWVEVVPGAEKVKVKE